MSKLNVNEIQPVGGGQTVTVTAAEITASSSTITASSFVGPLTGNSTGLTGTPNVVVGIVTATEIAGVSTIGVTTVTATTLTVNGNNYPSAGALSNRNLIINGAMQVAQRGTSSTGNTSGGYFTCDRWNANIDTMGTWSFDQSSTVPSGSGFTTSLKVSCTTADASPAAADAVFIQHRIEGQNLQQLAKGTSSAKAVTLSFWVRSSKTGTHIVELRDDINTRHIAKSYTIAAADTWQFVPLTFDGDTSGTLTNSNIRALDINFWLGGGSDFTSGTLATSWAARTLANAAVGQVNLADSASNEWYITGVQLEVGSVATPFEHRSFGDELARCQRYYYRITGSETSSSNSGLYGIGFSQSSTAGRSSIHLPVTMRTFPEALEQSGTASHYRVVAGSSGSINCSAVPTFSTSNTKTIDISWTVASGATANQGVYFMSNSASSYIGVSAEL